MMTQETIVDTILTDLEQNNNVFEVMNNHNLNQEDVYSAFLSKGIDMSEWND